MCNDKFECAFPDTVVLGEESVLHSNKAREGNRWRWPGVDFPPKSFEAVPEGREA